MKVYKFGGASVKSADGVRNISHIIGSAPHNLVIVISAMGKTTNALEKVLEYYLAQDKQEALKALQQNLQYHLEIVESLLPPHQRNELQQAIIATFNEAELFIEQNRRFDYDFCYDQLVPTGELASTKLVSGWLNSQGIKNEWLDARKLMRTDSNFREGNVLFDESEKNFKTAVDFTHCPMYITQGFIGGNPAGESTTLGREGSDYTAAIIANLLDAESVTIWKDVPGILNADPRLFPNTVLLPVISYKEAVEFTYYGAQIIHPKTIKPLHNKNIPLYVKSFENPTEPGTQIATHVTAQRSIPIYIVKPHQRLISIFPKDLSFALEETLSEVFALLHRHRLKVNLIQNSAVSISVCVDDNRRVNAAIDELGHHYKVLYNQNLELLTIRNYTSLIITQQTKGRIVLLTQKSRKSARVLMEARPISKNN